MHLLKAAGGLDPTEREPLPGVSELKRQASIAGLVYFMLLMVRPGRLTRGTWRSHGGRDVRAGTRRDRRLARHSFRRP